MDWVLEGGIYFALFITLYFQVFLLLTIFEKGVARSKPKSTSLLPTVTVIVPCFNEADTVGKTIETLRGLDYPKDKLEIIVVDDGSKDNTYQIASTYSNDQISVYRKENGGKHTALNFAIPKTNSEIVGCLDADSFVEPDALRSLVKYFEDPEVMAVTPMILVSRPKTIIQKIQSTEYILSALLRYVFSLLGALYVTPGPFSFYRKVVFNKIGQYKHSHNTEDLEIALRMQSHRLKIVNAPDARVFTVAPQSARALVKQRVRWVYGFIKNAVDYRFMIMRKYYGNLGFFSLPLAIISIGTALFLAGYMLYAFLSKMYEIIVRILTVGISLDWPPRLKNWFFVDTEPIRILQYLSLTLLVIMLVLGSYLAYKRVRPLIKLDTLYFVMFYGFLAPIWLFKAVYDATFGKMSSWR